MAKTIFHLQTFGCQMNAHDSDWLSRSLQDRGFAAGSFEDASVHILNTCSVRDKPEQKVYSELGRIARRSKGRQGVLVCVGGCVAQQVGPALIRRFPQVRLLFGADGIARAPDAVSRLLEEPSLRLNLLDFAEEYEERAFAGGNQEKPVAAFVNIMQGCDNFCTYCIVPYVRGRQKSRPPKAVLTECRELLAAGAREIVLLGQNVNAYGQEGNNGREGAFARLLRQVAALPGLARLRFVTSHPKDIAPEVIAAFGDMEALCPRLHLPLQSGSDKILRQMGRSYDAARYLDIVGQLRAARPDILLTTDIIVGFPGETEEDFSATMRLMEQADFAASFSFVYSDRPRARASLLPGKVDRALALERLSRLQIWQDQVNARVLTSTVGGTTMVLLEEPSRRPVFSGETADKDGEGGSAKRGVGLESWQGRTPHGLLVHVPLPRRERGGWKGSLLPVAVVEAGRHCLKAVAL
ncbi:MAG: tRNA (N6-isopentenyl adenosine(37)-C2)-methylthiotransferase MiaB [Desulfovibrio sp.]|jgi:tRNA-2-methylthio-N6-dimethylallyladenosine synthase|nr:tRNA (N6-isopentenyl adenosine(37)-C2)-methylthiotransferase MiaB [Desulfovibrio sp.]